MKSIPFNTSRYTVFLLALGIFFSSQSVAADRCEPQENNEYEKIFCQLKRSGRGENLPSIYQFRENPPITQALLLKKPAERAGIIIKIPERNNQETLQRQEELLATAPAAQREGPRPLDRSVRIVSIIQQAPPVVAPVEKMPAVSAPVEQKQAITTVAIEKPVVEDKPAALAMENCVLQQQMLQCADGHYQLVGNKTNQQLSGDVLSDNHKLALPVYSGATDDAAALEVYLENAYSRYLAGMMEIGLGASTMSYGKFVNLHKYITDQGLDFVGRFETMYQFLKKDKQTIGVSTKLNIAEGLTMQSCSPLENIIVCDYQKSNYIFVRAD
jgi:hypothetical protein